MAQSANLGFPRVGLHRELKKVIEQFWKGEVQASALEQTAKDLRKTHWELQKSAGINLIPSNDFSYYDHILDTICLVGAIPARYGFTAEKIDHATYFAMARGTQSGGKDITAMEMTKWFDTNYHYIVPEWDAATNFSIKSEKIFAEFAEAKALGIETRPVLVGPVTLLLVGKAKGNFNKLSLLDKLLPVYGEIIARLKKEGAKSIQIDEPALVLNLDKEAQNAYTKAYAELAKAGLPIFLTTYFGELRDNQALAFSLPVEGIHLDFVRGEASFEQALAAFPKEKKLSLGLIDGRNIWKANLSKALAKAKKAAEKLGKENILIAPSCSLLHTPVDLDEEKKLDAELKNWLAFSKQKLAEVATLTAAINEGEASVKAALDANATAIKARETSPRIHNKEVKSRAAAVTPNLLKRRSDFNTRIAKQEAHLKLPLLPTTTIGSLPQTPEIRAKRAELKAGKITEAQYDAFMEQKTKEAIKFQDDIGIDVPVHGEYERNDMVEYFGEQLKGFAFTQNGWVQSYGSRCVKPPIIFGDVSRPEAMTVRWSQFAQTLTKRPMKGMLTGPVTILQWSFVRDDQPRSETCKQIALAILDEVQDLEKAGISVIQIDEPAIREGLPLRREDWKNYLKWAVDAFRLSSSDVNDETQIHTHMCYSEFNDIIDSIADMDADVISIETSRSQMELLDAFVNFKYPNQIGPGVYDIHSPRIPTTQEMEQLLEKALKVLSPQQIWVNPDCGLKTRGWKEVEPALKNMVAATQNLRGKLNGNKKAANG